MSLLSAVCLHQITVIPARMMIGVWLLTALGLWSTAGVSWASEMLCHLMMVKLSLAALLGVVLLLLVGGFYLMKSLHRLNTSAVALFYLIFITLAGMMLGHCFTSQGVAVVLGIAGGMFAVSACICWLIDRNPGSVGQLILMSFYGIIITAAVNGALDSSPSRWFYSLSSVVVWAVAAGCENETLRGYACKMYTAEFYTQPRCIVLGAVTLYLSVIAFFRRLILALLDFIPYICRSVPR